VTLQASDSAQSQRGFLRRIEGRWWLYALGVIFRLLLELAYKDFVVPVYGGSGFPMVENAEKYLESWLLYVGLLLLLPASARRPSDFLICFAFFVFAAPLLVFYGFADASRWAMYCVLVQYAIMRVLPLGRPVRLPVIKQGPATALWLSIAGIIVATSWMITSGALATFNLNLSAVYEFRDEAGSALNVGAFSYVIVWVTTVCGPIALMLALRDRRRILALGIILLHVFWFGITSHKAVLFYPALVVFLNFLFKRSRALSLIPIGMSFVVLIALISYYATENVFLSALFVRRVFFIPSQLTFTYYQFFELNPFVYWSNSFLSGMVDYPYDESVPLVIGKYLNQPDAWANSAFFSTGYMHAGLLGVVIYGLLVGALLKVLDSLVSRRVPLWMTLSVVIVPFFILFTSADLTTALLTHGLGFAVFMLYLMKLPREAQEEGQIPRTQPGSAFHGSKEAAA
jgi:O-antigen polymerase